MRHLKILISLFLCLCLNANAQDKVLDKTVSVNYRDSKIKDVLLGLESKYGVKFYYANNMVPLQNRVSVNLKNQPLRVVLETVFQNTDISYVMADEKIVLRKDANKPKKQKQARKQTQQLPVKTEENTLVASVDLQSLMPAFSLTEVQSVPVVDANTFNLEQLEELKDTSIRNEENFTKQKNRLLKRYMAKMDSLGKIGDVGGMEELKEKFGSAMHKLKTKVKAIADSLKVKSIPLFRDNKDTALIKAPAQLTFVHPIGTNGSKANRVVNNLSINVLTGYAYALDGAEFAGLVNTEKAYVKGAQFAGIANIVGTDVNGAQFAGITNVTGGMANGAQFAGISNINGDNAIGIQAAGIVNTNNGSFLGAQLAGIANVNNGSGAGFQAAGIANVNNGPSRGTEIAGIVNFTKEEHNGVQMAGILNKAKRVRGSQIGLINIADTVTGVTLGLINIVKNGYNKLEVYGSEALYGNVAFRFGSQKFHTIAAIGVQPSSKSTDMRFGYGGGFGSVLDVSRKSSVNFDLMAMHIQEGTKDYTNKLNLLSQFKVMFATKLSGKLYAFAGPTFNVMVSQHYDKARGVYGSQLMPNVLFDETPVIHREEENFPTNVKGWIGFNAGLRF